VSIDPSPENSLSGLSLVEAQDSGSEAPPEAMLISALLESGQYEPRRYGVADDAIRAFRPVHEWCLTYQASGGEAPPVHLVMRKFPSFTYLPSISPAWAAHEVQQAATNVRLRKALAKAAVAIHDESHEEAIAIMREAAMTTSSASRPGTMMNDFTPLRDAETMARCPIPPGILSGLTGGHGAGQLWLIASLWGTGKTWKLIEHAIAAAEAGWPTLFISCEQSIPEILDRLHTVALRETPEAMFDLEAREAAVAAWSEWAVPVEVRGPMDGRVDASVIAGAVEKGSRTLVLVDYVGKMFTLDGHYAGEDHVMQKVVSNELKFTAAELGVPIFAAAQLNRVGQLGGSIALEQDADLILEQSRVSSDVNSIRKNRLVKTRHTGSISHWYSRFDPSAARFEDITHDEAIRLKTAEELALYT
jgi:hypothetical protein